MVPMCWGGVAGYGTHVLGWSSWLWYPCVGVESIAGFSMGCRAGFRIIPGKRLVVVVVVVVGG